MLLTHYPGNDTGHSSSCHELSPVQARVEFGRAFADQIVLVIVVL